MEGPTAKQQAGAGLGGHCSPGEAETQEQSQIAKAEGSAAVESPGQEPWCM